MSSACLELLKRENVPALGCTEPMAAAYATVLAVQALGAPCTALRLEVSANIAKNAMGVGIPGSVRAGLPIACALAWVAGRPELGLEVLKEVTDADEETARRLLDEGRVQVLLADTDEPLFIRATGTGAGHTASALIRGHHTNLVRLERDGAALALPQAGSAPHADRQEAGPALSLREIWDFAVNGSADDLDFLREGILMNEQAAHAGLQGEYGLGVGRMLREQWLRAGARDPALYAAAMTAAAADTRMAGCSLPVMTVAGSGNQGIATILPPYTLCQLLGKDAQTALRAVALCQLVALYAKQYSGRLSALCGAANAAAPGIAAAAVYLYGGDFDAACRAVQNVVGDLAGLICDGAKGGCALKLATGVQTGLLCAQLALLGRGAGEQDGIVARDADQTLRDLGLLAQEGMRTADRVVLEIMLNKASS